MRGGAESGFLSRVGTDFDETMSAGGRHTKGKSVEVPLQGYVRAIHVLRPAGKMAQGNAQSGREDFEGLKQVCLQSATFPLWHRGCLKTLLGR